MKKFIVYSLIIKKYFGNQEKILSGKILFQTDSESELNKFVSDEFSEEYIFGNKLQFIYTPQPFTSLYTHNLDSLEDYRNGYLNTYHKIIVRDTTLNDEPSWIWFKYDKDLEQFRFIYNKIRTEKMKRLIE